jgi:RimJ/RimL family protein N-acetyltransferase
MIYKTLTKGGYSDLLGITNFRKEEQDISLSHLTSLDKNAKYVWALKVGDGIYQKPIAVCGLRVIRGGCAEAWLVGSQDLKNYKVWMTKAIRFLLVEHQEVRGEFHRIQATVREDWKMAGRWIERLGFNFEGVMRKYDSEKNNYVRYARVL